MIVRKKEIPVSNHGWLAGRTAGHLTLITLCRGGLFWVCILFKSKGAYYELTLSQKIYTAFHYLLPLFAPAQLFCHDVHNAWQSLFCSMDIGEGQACPPGQDIDGSACILPHRVFHLFHGNGTLVHTHCRSLFHKNLALVDTHCTNLFCVYSQKQSHDSICMHCLSLLKHHTVPVQPKR